MAAKKDVRTDNTYLISTDSTDNPKLGAKILSDGRESLFLDYYFGYTMAYDEAKDKMVAKKDRKREYLKLYLWQAPRTPIERKTNKDTLELAKEIRFERSQQLKNDKEGYRLKKRQQVNFIDYFSAYIESYTKKDIRMIQIALQRFKDFLRDTPEYTKFESNINPSQISSEMVEDFCEYLQSRSIGEGARSIYQRFKKVYKACAMDNNINYQKPFMNRDGKSITIKIDESAIVKDFLSPDEEKQLIATHYTGENTQTRNAFIFCLYTGMRFCDVKALTFGCFDFPNRLLTYEQSKTKGHSSHSTVTLPVTDALINLLGEQPEERGKDELVFNLPSHSMCLKTLRRWVARAGINKHITWHCGRHSFGTNMAATAAQKGLSIRVVQEMMGHSSLRYTERYTRVVSEEKKKMMNELSKLMGE